MTKRLAISQRLARTLLQAAQAEKGIVEVQIGETVYRFIPECYSVNRKPADKDMEIRL